MKTSQLFGLEFIDDVDYRTLLKDIGQAEVSTQDQLPLLITPNVDQIVKLHREENQALLEAAKRARYVLPDGQPLVWLSRLKYGKEGLQSRLTGSDFFPVLWEQLKATEKNVLLILPNAELGDRFMAEYDHCRAYAPPIFKLEDQAAYSMVLENILNLLSSEPFDHVLIGLGFPKQERLALDMIAAQSKAAKPPLFHLLGASFEFYYGTKARAPFWIQRLGLEFLHRMFSEPGRMIKRYLWDDLAFFPLAWKEWRDRGNPTSSKGV